MLYHPWLTNLVRPLQPEFYYSKALELLTLQKLQPRHQLKALSMLTSAYLTTKVTGWFLITALLVNLPTVRSLLFFSLVRTFSLLSYFLFKYNFFNLIFLLELSSARINPTLNIPDDGQEEQEIKDKAPIDKNWTQQSFLIYGVTFCTLIMGSILLHKLLLVGVKSFWYSTTTSSSSEHPRDNITAEQSLFSTAIELKNGLVQVNLNWKQF